MVTALAVQVPIAVLFSLILDGGYLARICGIVVIVFWGWAGVVMLQRPVNPSWWDLLYVRWGFLPLLAVGIFVGVLKGYVSV